MSEERLKEIKDNMGIQLYSIENVHLDGKIIGEKWELYNEVVRLRDILNNIVNAIDDILKQNNLTLEQLTGVENE